eukprot:1173953-Amphidinium_carterae.1
MSLLSLNGLVVKASHLVRHLHGVQQERDCAALPANGSTLANKNVRCSTLVHSEELMTPAHTLN